MIPANYEPSITRAVSGRGFQGIEPRDVEPSEPCTNQRADELLAYISDLRHEAERLRAISFEPNELQQGVEKQKTPMSLDGKIAMACSQAASLCGDLRTINNRLGG